MRPNPPDLDVILEHLHVTALAMIEGDLQHSPGVDRRAHHRRPFEAGSRQRLLRQNVLAAFQRRNRHRRVQIIRRRDADGVDVVAGDQIVIIGILVGDVVSRGDLPAPNVRRIGDGDHFDAGLLQVRFQMRLASPAQPDDAYAQRFLLHNLPFL